DRVAQIIFERIRLPDVVDVGPLELQETMRGANGFGSTGGFQEKKHKTQYKTQHTQHKTHNNTHKRQQQQRSPVPLWSSPLVSSPKKQNVGQNVGQNVEQNVEQNVGQNVGQEQERFD